MFWTYRSIFKQNAHFLVEIKIIIKKHQLFDAIVVDETTIVSPNTKVSNQQDDILFPNYYYINNKVEVW
jgi:hypothetical protein